MEWDKQNPATLAQMDREKTLWDGKLDELIQAHGELKAVAMDSVVAYFELMEAMRDMDDWKMRATLAAAVERLVQC